MKKTSILIICICVLFIIALMIINSQQLSFINNDYNFYIRIAFPVIIVLILNLTIFKEMNGLKTTAIIFCIITIFLISLDHVFFEDLTYISEIDLNNDRNLIVKEQGVLGKYHIYFYEKEFFLFKKPLYNGKYLVTGNAPFSSDEYEIEYDKDNKVLIKYRNSRYGEYEEVTIQY